MNLNQYACNIEQLSLMDEITQSFESHWIVDYGYPFRHLPNISRYILSFIIQDNHVRLDLSFPNQFSLRFVLDKYDSFISMAYSGRLIARLASLE